MKLLLDENLSRRLVPFLFTDQNNASIAICDFENLIGSNAYTLQELLTIKSDDMQGRNEALNAIVKGYPIPRPGTPESFKVLLRELQALCLDISAYQISKKTNISQDQEINLMTESFELKENSFSNIEMNSTKV